MGRRPRDGDGNRLGADGRDVLAHLFAFTARVHETIKFRFVFGLAELVQEVVEFIAHFIKFAPLFFQTLDFLMTIMGKCTVIVRARAMATFGARFTALGIKIIAHFLDTMANSVAPKHIPDHGQTRGQKITNPSIIRPIVRGFQLASINWSAS